MEIKLLAAPVVLPPASEVNADSTSLVSVSQLPASNQVISRSDSAYPSDSYVWSALTGGGGSFHFYAVPLKNFLDDGGSGRQGGLFPASGSAPGWNPLTANHAMAQYRLQASLSMPLCGNLLNVYA